MFIQLANIVAGFILAAPKLKTLGAKAEIEQAETKLNEFRGIIGIVELALGVFTLLLRMGIIVVWTPWLWSSYPQSLVAIAVGLILSANLFKQWPSVHEFITKLEAYGEWIGVLGILVGLFSIF